MPVRGLADLADAQLLKFIWKKRLRTGLRKMPLKDFQLGHDPLELLAFDWEIDATIDQLVRDIATLEYRAGPAELIRAAKSVGLTRPLSFLNPRDLLVYITLISLLESQLLATMDSWVSFGRSQGKGADADSHAESGWFRLWLRRQNQIWTITNNCKWLVESDIANFFASLTITSIYDHVNNNAQIDQDAAGLLRHMLDQFSPMRGYLPSRIGGLPQENFDGSRVIAHTYLKPLDQEFSIEGKSERYTRWVDDIVVGADDWPSALQIVRRIQNSLEGLDLFANSSKTRIIRQSSFTADYMKIENDYIGTISDEVEEHGHPRNLRRLRSRIQKHARTPERKKAWERVLRRYYTLSRRIGDDSLMRWWDRHMTEAPGSAPHILEYLASFPLSTQRVERLQNVIKEFGGTYEDVDLLAIEYLVSAPNSDSKGLRTQITEWMWDVLHNSYRANPRLAASSVLAIGKFGYASDFDRLGLMFWDQLETDSPCRQQMTVLLLSLGRIDAAQLPQLLHGASSTTAQHIRFLAALSARDKTASRMAAALLQPRERWHPFRHYVRPRALILSPLVRQGWHGRWSKQEARWQQLMKGNSPRLRDAAIRRWLSGDQAQIIA